MHNKIPTEQLPMSKLSEFEKATFLTNRLLAAYKHTYAANINPEAVPDLLDACKQALYMYNKLQPAGGWQSVQDSLIMAIEQAENIK